MTVQILEGDCRETLRALSDNSLDSCVTDPPYALVSVVKRFGSPNGAPAKGNDAYMRASNGFMGKTWDTGKTAMSVAFWAEVYRVLKPGAFVAAFGATRGYHRMTCAIEDAGFEIRDSLMWVYGTGFPKSHNAAVAVAKHFNPEWKTGDDIPNDAREWEGWGTALKPAFEPIVLARKPLSEPTVAANVLRWRTGALNIAATRVGAEDVQGVRHRYGGGIKGAGTSFELPDSKGEIPPGRWPANVITDGSDEVIAAFPTTTSGVYTGKRNQPKTKNTFGTFALRDEDPCSYGDSGSAARFFYSAKASKADRNGSKHPTVKPIALMAWLARLITPPGGTILDPFAGSGTTGAAAIAEGFNAILCEREAEYIADIKRRLGTPARMPWETAPTAFPWAAP